ncbi:uncharacterized protein [Rutidosis leptorrhynchoides]|uniref:uncharacterized protein n=1 Tax=Rutidosis leptorrhynchoides TaxID=125765 RepID=UPI003A99E7AA
MHGYFKGKRDLRQSDPMSPYLFMLVMEVLSLMLQRKVVQLGDFKYHPKCEQSKIINLCFAGDLFLFSQTDTDSMEAITDALNELKIVNHKESLWVKWIHTYHLHNKSFWNVPIKPDSSWSWRKILQTREVIHKLVFHSIGNGQNTHAWFDVWNDACPLTSVVSWRDINGAGFNAYSSVADIITNDQWGWQIFWYQKNPILLQMDVPSLQPAPDVIKWKGVDSCLQNFSVANAYEDIHPKGIKFIWFRVVWFSQRIPRHAFIVWLL